jgi:large subunit ribosomal protein L32
MATPKRKTARARSAKRRSQWKGEPPSYNVCPRCRQPKLPHRVCGNCGFYGGRQAVEVEIE